MATPTIESYGKKNVLIWFANQPGTEWRLFRQYNTKKAENIIDGYADEDKEDSTERLSSTLDTLDNEFNFGTYTLVVENGKYPAQLYFKIKASGEATKHVAGINQTQTDPALLSLLQKQSEQINELSLKMASMEDDEAEEPVNPIIGLMQHDLYGPIIATAISGIVNKFMPGTPTALAGIPDEQDIKIDEAIKVLKKYDSNLGDHLTKLADIAVNNNVQFNMLLKML